MVLCNYSLLKKEMMLILRNISYRHPNKDLLLDNINVSIGKQNKIALIGNNGTGKSTLLKIMAGILAPASGSVQASAIPYYLPQLQDEYNELSIARALQIEDKLKALHNILGGEVTETNLALLNDDWGIEERCHEALTYWKLAGLDLDQKMNTLSGGQKTKIFLAGIAIHQPEIVLLDEPSNHLDSAGRALLYDYISSASVTWIVVSHDRKLLDLLDPIYELSKRGITIYGGNYDFYAAQKQMGNAALHQDVKSKEKELRKAKETARVTAERQQKLDARGKKKQEQAGLPTISMNTLRNNAEKSTSRIKGTHTEKIDGIAQDLNELRKELPDTDKMKLDFVDMELHTGKILFTAKDLNYSYNQHLLWKYPSDVQITSGERIALKGPNGAGKTTLIRIILGRIEPCAGTIQSVFSKPIYIDQDYSLIDPLLHVYQQAEAFNQTGLQEHEIKNRLNRFLFTKEHWNNPCAGLSGGEKMRLILCCLTISNQAPDLIILDEPTNNLDMQNIEILTEAINSYKGTLLVISHDEYFLEQLHIERTIELN